ENDFIRRLAVSRGDVHGLLIGAMSQPDGTFGWLDGSKMDYNNFYPGFPQKDHGDCTAMDTGSNAGQWMNVNCSSKLPVACMRQQNPSEQPAEPTCTGEGYGEGKLIVSPGYPYSASTPCDFVLSVEAGKKVELEILSLEANSCCDSLIIYDGNTGGSVIANLTGIVTSKKFTTPSNVMRASWRPNGGVNVKGVAMVYNSV
ncbi:hypothetical protein PMAYCL1PPCAC_26267, partial [Pristionchus mayeri]